MKNVRTYTLTAYDKKHFEPMDFYLKLVGAGFVFDRAPCPFVIRKPWDTIENTDGSTTYRQWSK
jgi:hypothetical protein